MGIKTWEVEFGWNYDSRKVIAKDCVEALEKALNLLKVEYGKSFEKETKNYWIRKVECVVETDEEE